MFIAIIAVLSYVVIAGGTNLVTSFYVTSLDILSLFQDTTIPKLMSRLPQLTRLLLDGPNSELYILSLPPVYTKGPRQTQSLSDRDEDTVGMVNSRNAENSVKVFMRQTMYKMLRWHSITSILREQFHELNSQLS